MCQIAPFSKPTYCHRCTRETFSVTPLNRWLYVRQTPLFTKIPSSLVGGRSRLFGAFESRTTSFGAPVQKDESNVSVVLGRDNEATNLGFSNQRRGDQCRIGLLVWRIHGSIRQSYDMSRGPKSRFRVRTEHVLHAQPGRGKRAGPPTFQRADVAPVV
jgi:hypothetical protein